MIHEPVRGLQVQLASPRAEQRGIGALLNQGVSKQEIVALWHDQGVGDQRLAGVVGRINEPPQQVQIERWRSRRRFERPADRARATGPYAPAPGSGGGGDHILAALFGIAQQLLEKQGIAGGALDTGERQALAGVDETAGQA